MRKSAAQARREVGKARAEVLALINKPCITVDFDIDYGDTRPPAEEKRKPPPPMLMDGSGLPPSLQHKCGPQCLVVDMKIYLDGKPCDCGRCVGCLHRNGNCSKDNNCALCSHAEFIARSPRFDEPQDLLVPARPETPARDVVAVMRPEARPRPQLPAPSTVDIYGRDPAYLPDCACGHRAAVHRELSLEAVCVRCGLPDGDHAYEDVLVLSGPRPCEYRHPFPGCAVVDPSGPCCCRAYQEAA